jgi:hypothetical protein
MTLLRRLTDRAARTARVALIASCALGAVVAHAQDHCGPLENPYGPFDYRDYKDLRGRERAGTPISLVEDTHFLEACEAMIRCAAGVPGGEFDYTLRVFPNHHRALLAMARLADRYKAAVAPNARYTPACYFERAIRWRPDDIVARMLYVIYLKDHNAPEAARKQFDAIRQLAPTNPYTVYNLGMVALDLGDVDFAVEAARRSYGAGMVHPELKQRLVALKRWGDADEQAVQALQAGEAASAPSGAASAAPAASAPAAPASAPVQP